MITLTGEVYPGGARNGRQSPGGARPALTVSSPQVLSEHSASAIDRILTLIEEAEERRAPVSGLLTVSARIIRQSLWSSRCW
ncbi:hypothetical protein KCP69_04525 [Salmonella enterica subsp. enterica]|nr:hypothetical protein KCP69_04525 [Salmonella enterica subsp. enterica]